MQLKGGQPPAFIRISGSSIVPRHLAHDKSSILPWGGISGAVVIPLGYQAYARGLWSSPKSPKYVRPCKPTCWNLYLSAKITQELNIAAPLSGVQDSGSGLGMTDPRITVNSVSNNGESNGEWTCTFCLKIFTTKIGLGVHKSRAHRDELNDERLSQPQVSVRRSTDGERKRNAISSRRPWTESEIVALAKLHLDIRMAQPHVSEAAINRELANMLPGRSVDSIKGQKKGPAFQLALNQLESSISATPNIQSGPNQDNGSVESGCDSSETVSTDSGELGTSNNQVGRTIPSGTASGASAEVIASPTNHSPLEHGEVTNTTSDATSRYNQVDYELLAKLKEDTRLYARHIKTKSCFGIKHLLYVLQNYRRGDPAVIPLLESWLDLVIKQVTGNASTNGNKETVATKTRKIRQMLNDQMISGSNRTLRGKARQLQYEYLQNLYKRKGIRPVAQHVLKDNSDDDMHSNCSNVETPATKPTSEEMYQFWKQTFDSCPNNEPIVDKLNIACGNNKSNDQAWANCIWVAVTIDDIKRSEVANGKAPGPDRISAKTWKQVPQSIRALFYNVVMFHGVVLPNVAQARTVFIPKVKHPSKPDEYRPISIASVVGRQLHKIFANKLTAVLRMHDQQVAFRRGVDGSLNNMATFRTIVEDAKKTGKTVHMVTMDLKRAFPSVQHSAIIRTMSELGCPTVFLEYLAQLYSKANTYLELQDGQLSPTIQISQGVFQGDPLSPCIFNYVMDRALHKLDDRHGYKCGGVTIPCMAFADDVVIIGESEIGTQLNLNSWLNELNRCGLYANPSKCLSLSMLWDGHRKVHTLETNGKFTINGNHVIRPIGPTTQWKYLGFNLTGEKIDRHLPPIQDKLNLVEHAILKPQQKLEIISKIIVPSLTYQAVLGSTAQGELNSIDTQIRTTVRRIMHLPNDVPNCYIHAPVRCGGMGIPELAFRIPINRYKRYLRFVDSNAKVAIQFDRSIAFRTNKEYTVKLLQDNELTVDKDYDLIAKYYLDNLERHYATKGLSEAYSSRVSRSWCGTKSDKISGNDFVKYHLLSSYSIPTLSRRNWGRNPTSTEQTNCRDGCGRPETMHHIQQECKLTHGGRVLRHDRALNYIFQVLQAKWAGIANVVKEPQIQTPNGLRKPDLIFYSTTGSESVAYVIDLHIVGGEYMSEARERKISKYRDLIGMTEPIRNRYRVKKVWYESITISNVGIIERSSLELLKKLDFSSKAIFRLVTSVLRGSWLNWFCFRRTHQRFFRLLSSP